MTGILSLVALPVPFPQLLSLELLCSAIELRSLSQAAAAHRMAQPSATARMKKLEQQLGVKLLYRTPSGSAPTAAGVVVAEWAARVIEEAEALATGVAGLRQIGDSLRVVASYTVAEHLLPRWLSTLHQRHPTAAVGLEVANSADVIRRLRDGDGDADLGFVESPSTGGLSSRDVATDELVVVVAPEHPWARRRRPVSAALLSSTALVLREEGSGTRDALVVALAHAGLDRPVAALELGSTAAVRAAVAANAAPAVLSRIAVDPDVLAGRLVVVVLEGIDLTRRLRAVWHPDRPLHDLAMTLLDYAGSTRQVSRATRRTTSSGDRE